MGCAKYLKWMFYLEVLLFAIPTQSLSQSSLSGHELETYWSKKPRFRLEAFSRGNQTFYAALWLPRHYHQLAKKGAKFPGLILFSGYSEAAKPAKRSAFGWLEDCRLPAALEHLEKGVLSQKAFEGMAGINHLSVYKSELKAFPIKPMVIISVTTLGRMPFEKKVYHEYEHWLVHDLRLTLEKKYAVDRNKIGIDGVSWGGAWALYLFSKYPSMFYSRGALQPAYRVMDLVHRHIGYHRGLKGLRFYIATSQRDYLRRAIENLSRSLGKKGFS